MPALADMHMHAGFSRSPELLADGLRGLGIDAFSVTVTPQEYENLNKTLNNKESVHVGLGLHPWWVEARDMQGPALSNEALKSFELFESLLATTRFVGEVGLDFHPRHASSRNAQLQVFERITALCAKKGACLISLHCVKADRELVDVLVNTGCLDTCTCILHSFGGSSDMLKRAVDLGFLFSIGQRMLATKRGREYARIIPQDRLLLESDLPEHSGSDADAREIEASLEDALTRLAEIRHVDACELGDAIYERSTGLLASA